MEKMKQIESKEDFLKWAHSVNLSCESKRNGIADLQDVFYRGQDGELKQLKEWFLEVNSTEKQLLTFSIIKAMGEETAYKFIKTWARKQASIYIEEYEKEYTIREKGLYEKEKAFSKEKKGIEELLDYAKKEVKELNESLDNSRINNDGLHQTITRLEERNSILNEELETVYKSLNETNKFKAYLKYLINPEAIV